MSDHSSIKWVLGISPNAVSAPGSACALRVIREAPPAHSRWSVIAGDPMPKKFRLIGDTVRLGARK